MKHQLNTLALNLLISERFGHRLDFAVCMKNAVDSEQDLSPLAEIFREHFFYHIDRCVVNPNCSSRQILYYLADFWMTHFKTPVKKNLAAA